MNMFRFSHLDGLAVININECAAIDLHDRGELNVFFKASAEMLTFSLSEEQHEIVLEALGNDPQTSS